MSATNATTNYSFPLFIGTDKPAWLVDWNSAMSAIDAAIKGVDTDVQGAIVDISGLSSTVASHTSSISTISGQITVITTNLNTATGNINTINSLIGNGTPTTTDQTIIGAINEINAKVKNLEDPTAASVSYDNTSSGLTATDVQAAIDELAQGSGGTVEADDVVYDNTQSGLAATNVQAAINEVNERTSAYTFGTAVSIPSATITAGYTAPSDGYVHVTAESSTASYINVSLNGVISQIAGVAAAYPSGLLYVRKGMVVKEEASGYTVPRTYTFLPLV